MRRLPAGLQVVRALRGALAGGSGGASGLEACGADNVTLDPLEMRAVVDEADKRGLTVAAHAHRPEGIPRGLAAGVGWTAPKRRILAYFSRGPRRSAIPPRSGLPGSGRHGHGARSCVARQADAAGGRSVPLLVPP